MSADAKSVFIIDDHLGIQKILSDSLSCLGYNTMIASDGFEAVETYREKRDEIGVIILDIIMPGMNGIRTLKKLKEINPLIKVIMCSAYFEQNQLPELNDTAVQGFLSKPYTMNGLSQKMEMALST
jgi:CheY-like chemotaxis protein